MDAPILVGYAWAHEPRTGASVVAPGTNRGAAQGAAVDLAQAFWEARHGFQFAVLHVLKRLLAYQIPRAAPASLADTAAGARRAEAGIGARIYLSLVQQGTDLLHQILGPERFLDKCHATAALSISARPGPGMA